MVNLILLILFYF